MSTARITDHWRFLPPVLVAALTVITLACQPGGAPPEPAGEEAAEAREGDIEAAESDDGVEVAKSGGGTATLPLDDDETMARLQGLGLTPAPTIRLTSPTDGATVEAGTTVEVHYEIDNYEVGKGPDMPNQHVHVILDDRPYEADYAPTGSVTFSPDELSEGTHVLTAFLAREMHLSLKNPGASAQALFHVGAPDEGWTWEVGQPRLVYSRPKGSYARADGSAANIMLDFYLFDAEIGAGAYRVRATVDGGEPFLITEWAPRIVLENPETGEHTVRLELLDAEDNPVPGPTNDTTRTIEVVTTSDETE